MIIQFRLMRDPPQMWLLLRPFFTRRETCHGHECGAASSPFTIRVKRERLPHLGSAWLPEKEVHFQYRSRTLHYFIEDANDES